MDIVNQSQESKYYRGPGDKWWILSQGPWVVAAQGIVRSRNILHYPMAFVLAFVPLQYTLHLLYNRIPESSPLAQCVMNILSGQAQSEF